MANIFDYMIWRDIDIKNVEINEIDALILSRLSYFPLDNLNLENETITLKEAYNRYCNTENKGRILQKEDTELFPVLANSIRFGNILLSNYVNKIDNILEKQFSAITIELPDNTIFVSYRGTDNTIVGWKEDFNMSFKDLVPSQVDAVNYLNNIATKYKQNIRVAGHSKGGNLAVYASAFCNKEVNDRIIAIYNNDGPGFQKTVIDTNEYKNTIGRLRTYIPQTSIIGRLLNHKEATTIIKSTQTGIMQHDLYSWQLLGAHFIEDTLTNSSEFIDQTITNWLNEVSPEQREKFIDTLFEILNATEAKTLAQLSSKKFETAKIILSTYKNIDEESKEIISKTLGIGSNNDLIMKKIREEVQPDQIILITGIGKCYGIVRGHTILNNLHSIITNNPLIMFYPGSYDGQSFKLFNRLENDNYYRAFQFVSRK